MPRISITISLVDDENRQFARESWSLLSYEDLGNPNLAIVEGTLINGAERNLLERLRTSIDRSLLTFARRERRRFRSSADQPNPDNPDIFEDNPAFYQTEPELLGNSVRELTESQRMALIANQQIVENQMTMGPKKSVRPIRRVSRYKRDPVI
jgi:hypothetical protein